jgi:hypothetical protein
MVTAVAVHLPDRVALADGRDVEQASAGRPCRPVQAFLPGVRPFKYGTRLSGSRRLARSISKDL